MAANHDGGGHPVGVPSCGTGPVGHIRFVAAELKDVWRELRGAGGHRSVRQRRDAAVHDIESVGEPPVTEKGF